MRSIRDTSIELRERGKSPKKCRTLNAKPKRIGVFPRKKLGFSKGKRCSLPLSLSLDSSCSRSYDLFTHRLSRKKAEVTTPFGHVTERTEVPSEVNAVSSGR
ncbi:hypothetical protein BHE74_00021402 [Ensete ventricosum]|nr:hypothetical protein GW17_00006395 [Ensete ventricosum]RWW70894.1 hypothetical protein BHE74_00021402 [Ensete ventricosum]